jgi:hypothetical protein
MAKKRENPSTPPETPPTVLVDGKEVTLTDEEQCFVNEYEVDRNAIDAARRCYPTVSVSTARRRADEMLARPHVAAEIRARRAAQRRRCQVEADLVLDEICNVAFSDILGLYDQQTGLLRMPRQIPYNVRKAISSVKISRERRYTVTETSRGRTSQTTVTDTVIEYKLWPKMEALEKLCRYLGLDTEVPDLEKILNVLPKALGAQVRQIMLAEAQQNAHGQALTAPIEVQPQTPAESKPPEGSP